MEPPSSISCSSLFVISRTFFIWLYWKQRLFCISWPSVADYLAACQFSKWLICSLRLFSFGCSDCGSNIYIVFALWSWISHNWFIWLFGRPLLDLCLLQHAPWIHPAWGTGHCWPMPNKPHVNICGCQFNYSWCKWEWLGVDRQHTWLSSFAINV